MAPPSPLLLQTMLLPLGGKADDKPDGSNESEIVCLAKDFEERLCQKLSRELPEVNCIAL